MPDNSHKELFVPKGKNPVDPARVAIKFDIFFKSSFVGYKQFLSKKIGSLQQNIYHSRSRGDVE